VSTPTEPPSKISMFRHYSHRGPSRILWFFIGAATANWLLKRTDSDSRTFGHCRRLQYQTPLPNSSVPGGALSNDPSVPDSCEQQQSWQQEKEHLADISRKVADAMTDLTEATLDSVLSAAEALKVKLTEHRANREQQQSIIEQQIQETKQETQYSLPPA